MTVRQNCAAPFEETNLFESGILKDQEGDGKRILRLILERQA
jgi:hypothetical protein